MLIKFHVQSLCWEAVMLDLGEENNLRRCCERSGEHKDSQGIISTIIRRCDSIRDNQGIGAIYAKSQQKTCHDKVTLHH